MTEFLLSVGTRLTRAAKKSRTAHPYLICVLSTNLATSFPCVLPFSQMYPLCCIDIRNFLNQIYLFSDDYFQKSTIIDETLRTVCCRLRSCTYRLKH